MGPLTYYLVLRLVLLIRLYLADHRYVIITHVYIVVYINFKVASIGVTHMLCFHIDEVHSLLSIFLREVEVWWVNYIIVGSVGAIIIVVVECCCASTTITADERFIGDE